MKPPHLVVLINFADTARLDVAMTRDLGAIQSGLARVDSIGGTALLDAVHVAERYLGEHATRNRKALLIITDGKDNASTKTVKQIHEAGERGDAVIYAIGLFGDAPKDGRRELEELTGRTGGAAFFPAGLDEIDAVTIALAHQIRQQYTIGYTPTDQSLDGSYRTIRVQARGPERFTVHTRVGYRASPD